MTTKRRVVSVVLLVAVASACGGHGVTISQSLSLAAPSPAALPPVLPPVAGERWKLTTTLSAATGPASCIVDISHMHVGESYSAWLLDIERSGESVHLIVFDARYPADRYEYDGTITARALTVPIKSLSSAGYCGSRVEFRGENHVSGRFSEDGNTLTAAEDESLQLTSGAILTFHYDWRATRSE